MLLEVNNDYPFLEEAIRNKCGKKYSFLDRILQKILVHQDID